jgi:hypothetical protein
MRPEHEVTLSVIKGTDKQTGLHIMDNVQVYTVQQDATIYSIVTLTNYMELNTT